MSKIWGWLTNKKEIDAWRAAWRSKQARLEQVYFTPQGEEILKKHSEIFKLERSVRSLVEIILLVQKETK